MSPRSGTVSVLCLLLGGAILWTGASAALAQVNPAEIRSPELKALEQKYFSELKALNRAIISAKFPFAFLLSRYVNLEPQKGLETDTRGLEFVNFHDRVVLKIGGNYQAAYNANLLTPNQRASRTFQEVVAPILRLVRNEIPADSDCDAIGFEISYHVRQQTRNADFEGKEILVVIFDRADAFDYPGAPDDAARQEVLNRSEIYIDGERFGLALGEREPLNVEELGPSVPRHPRTAPEASGSGAAATPDNRLSSITREPSLGSPKASAPTVAGARPATPSGNLPGAPAKPETEVVPAPVATQADAERLQTQYQPQLDALAKEGLAKFHFVDYAPPSFVIFQNKVFLQLTLRNSLRFDRQTSSIYKRAAQSFDLFLAPQLKELLDKLPAGEEFDGLDITVLNQLVAKANTSSEAIEFICPLKALRQFAGAHITNQDLINQSVALVNGVRIALNLQLVE